MYRYNYIFHILYFLFWSLFCLSTAGHDWDPIHTVMEIDIRVFFEELGLQKWSYQLNGGMTRYNNLGTHHQSPWFLFFLSLGSYWGVKLFVPFIMTLSNLFFVNSLKKHFGFDEKKALIYSLIFSFNGFWLLHIYHGHMTYSAQYLFLVSILYFYNYLFKGERKDLTVGTALFFGSYSLSVYQILTYMGIPTFISLAGIVIYLLFKKNLTKVMIKRLLFIISSLFFSVLVYIPKILSALNYLGQNERAVKFLEFRSLVDVLYTFFLPTKTSLLPMFNLKLSPPWGIHEYSYFSLIYLWILYFLVKLVIRKELREIIKKYRPEFIFIITSFFISFILYLGDFIPNSPFRLMNELLFGGGQRVSQRYLLLGVASLHITGFYLVSRVSEFKKYQNSLMLTCILGGLYQVYNLINLRDIEHSKLVYQQYSNAVEFNDKMQYVIFPVQRYPNPAYGIILNNFATLNGFAPVPYKKHIGKKFLNSKPSILKPYYFLKHSDGSDLELESACHQKSYFTQTKIVIDESCPKRLNLLLTNIYSETKIKNYNYEISTDHGIQLVKIK